MSTLSRRIVAFVGAVLFAMVLGSAFDAAGVTESYDGDMTSRGLFVGVGLGLMLVALIRGDASTERRTDERSMTQM